MFEISVVAEWAISASAVRLSPPPDGRRRTLGGLPQYPTAGAEVRAFIDCFSSSYGSPLYWEQTSGGKIEY